MDWRNNILAEVGQGMGINGLNFGDTGVIRFQFEDSGSLYMELKESGVLMYLARDMDGFNNLSVMERALKESHYKKSFPFPLQVGIQGNQLFICLFLPDDGFSRPEVETAMQFLMSKADELIL